MRKYLLHVLIISFVFLLVPTAQVATYAGEIETRKEEARKHAVFTSENISIQIGERTWISQGKADRNHADSDGSPDVLSELIYNDVDSVITEFNVNALLYNRYIFNVDVGIGCIDGGKLTDRDYLGDNRTEIFSVSDSTVDDDSMYYVNADIGYRIFNKKKSSIDLLLGYQHWEEKYIGTEGRQQLGGTLGPFASQERDISERATWDSLRVGARASIEIFPKLSIKTRLMFVPWTHYELEDIHYMRSSHKKDPSFEAKADGGFGVMSDTTISYNIWKGLSIEAGYQIWDIESGGGTLTARPLNSDSVRTHFNEANNRRQGGIIGVYYAIPSVYAKRDTTELKLGKMSIILESSARFLSRNNNFSYAHMSQNLAPFAYTDREQLNYDSLGFGKKILIDYNINDYDSIEFSFQGATASSDSTRRLTNDTNGSIPSVPVIDGQSFGTNQHDLVISGTPSGIPNVSVNLEYDTWYVDTFLGLNRTITKNDNVELHGIAGLALAHFEQNFKHTMAGADLLGSLSSSDLDEELTDNLFGLKGGLRLCRRVTRNFYVEGSVFGGAYYRRSKLDADQTLINVGVPFGGRTDAFASVDDRDGDFVPRTEGSLKAKYKINDRWDLSFSSGVDAWWNMSNVNNPKLPSHSRTTGTPIDQITHIGDNDRLIEYHAGLAITFRN